MDKPEDITVPPAPSRLNPGNDLAAKGDTFFGFFQPFAAYMSAVSNFVAEKVGEVAATALSGTLPSLAGKAGQLIRVNAAATAAEFATGPQAQQSLGFHAFDNAFLGAGATGNLAVGATDFGNTARWLNIQTANGITLTRVGFGIDANGCTYVDYSVVGTPTTGSHTMDVYLQQSSVTAATSGQVFTTSCYAQIVGGTVPTDANTGIRVEMRGQTALNAQTEAFFTPVTRPTAQTLSTLTSTLAAATTAQIICGVTLRVQAGVTANFTIRISGLQFDRGAARLAYPFKAMTPAEAMTSLGLSGPQNMIIGRKSSGTGAAEVLTPAEARLAMGVDPAGGIQFFAMNAAPAGWLKANGALVSRTTYSALFAAIGTTFGAGDGSTTFALPDLRGEFLRGWDDGRGVDSGRAFGSAQSGAMQNHTHGAPTGTSGPYLTLTHGAGSSNNGSFYSGSGGQLSGLHYSTGGVDSPAVTAGDTRPRNIALLACIKF